MIKIEKKSRGMCLAEGQEMQKNWGTAEIIWSEMTDGNNSYRNFDQYNF